MVFPRHDHGAEGMVMDGDFRMDASQMNMVFFSSTMTPLYSSGWTPSSSGAYVGTCLFLVILAILFRASFGLKRHFERRWLHQSRSRRFVTVADQQPFSETIEVDPKSSTAVLTTNGVQENVQVVEQSAGAQTQPWRFSVDLLRALLVTTQATIGYLLMLAVMTLNIGYFVSVLAGIFVGEAALGRFSV